MKTKFTNLGIYKKPAISLLTGLLFLIISTAATAQLGVYSFTGNGSCPHQNPAVNSQPANAVFSNYTSVNTQCDDEDNVFHYKEWNDSYTIDLGEYNQFSLTPAPGYGLNLTTISFIQYASDNANSGTTMWYLRSSLDNYATDISTGTVTTTTQTPVINLPGSFSNIAAVTFRIYITNIKSNGSKWVNDEVTVSGSVIALALPADPANPTSNSPQCSSPGVTMNFNGTAPWGETWYWQTSPTGTSTANSSSAYTVFNSGTYYVRSRMDGGAQAWSSGSGSVTIVISANVATPVFTTGSSSTRCQGAGSVTYTATALNNTGITYSLDAASISGGNTINSSTGAVTFATNWNGASIITATAAGCDGPTVSTHIVTTLLPVTTPVFTSGASSFRCLGTGTVTYTANASNSTGITYSLDALSLIGGNTINAATGAVNYALLWIGTSTITATAAGCSGPKSATHTVTINGAVTTPAFTLGSTSTRCQGAGSVTYTATVNNASGLTYTLDANSTTGGNSINSTTGEVIYVAGWSGTTTITATATGCNGPKSATHTVTVTPTVGTPVFTLGATSTRCQGAGTVTYTATASNNTSRTYSLDAASLTGGNTINASTGAVTYIAGWVGTSTITVSAAGCNGPSTANHTVTITPTVGTPVFTLGATTTRCQGVGTVSYSATAANATGITYSLNAASISGGNSINASTGVVTYVATWSGTSIITANAAGCSGPVTATHTVTITPTVGAPVFTLGATSTRCQGANTVNYIANATNNTGITYSLDAASLTGGNTINTATGAVTYVAGWTGTSVITATATGCNGPKTANHTVTIKTTVGATSFTLGSTSIRCQGAGSVTYTASASNSTSITYSLDGASTTGGNTINSSTGVVMYVAGWSGTTTVTATAAGCNGPTSAIHTVTVTPTVGTPVFTLGASTTRCQGAGVVTYTATATTTTGITYSLDAASITGGNAINSTTGAVTYAAGWSGTSTITATAAGCNGPKTANHVVTITPTVGTPFFVLGLQSVRTQGTATITYSATASNNTGITYSLNAASISGGNTINTATGAVTWNANWNGVSTITATANGCNGPSTASHIVHTNSSLAQIPLYLSTGQILDRIDPVAAGITATLQTTVLSSTGATNTSFTLSPSLCNNLTIKAQTIGVVLYLNIASGTMPANPSITALIKYGSTNIINLTNPVYNSGNGTLSWTGTLGADVTIPSGQAIDLQINTAQAGVTFRIDYHSMTKPSRISLLPVSTFINFVSSDIYDAPYPAGNKRISGLSNRTNYVRSKVTTPYGYKDITGLDIKINPTGNTIAVNCVDSSASTRTYEYAWTTPAIPGAYYLLITAKEGYENTIKNSEMLLFDVCDLCRPVSISDSATGAGGAPLIVDVLANDYDPNNNMKLSTLSIISQPNNGTGFISNNKVVYLPNGTFAGRDTLVYQICDSTNLCATASVYFTINPLLFDPCSEATKTHVYYMPFAENEARITLDSSSSIALASNNIRTIISLKMPYPGMMIVWDHWEDGYETNALNPQQSTTKVWGDGNPYNGIVPGYADDIIPAGGSIVLDNTIPTNPRVAANILYDGRDKISTSGQITITQVSGEPSIIGLQCMKTNVTPTIDFGTSFTIPVGQDFNSRDFRYTSLFIRAAENNTVVEIDKDNNGSLETTATINEGQILFVNGGVLSGATVTSSKPIGVELHFGGKDNYSSREVPVYPAHWYSNTYYSPVPTTGRTTLTPRDTAVVMLYNSLNRPLTITWSSGVPSSGSLNIPAKSVIRFPLPLSSTAAYKFVNPTGESFTAIEIVDSYTPGTGGNSGADFDWAFNLIAENRLTDFATIAWAPGSTNGTRNDNPVWVTPTNNTTIYVKYDGNISGTSGLLSPCGMRYDVSYTLNALTHRRLRDPNDNDQSGIAVYTCDGTKLAAVYGEDPSTATAGNPSWDVGSTIQPFCKQKLIFANDDYGRTMVNQPVTIPILLNDFGFLAIVDPTSVTTTGFLQPKNGTVTINANGTVIYTPNPGYVGKDTFEYNVCSTPTPIVCDWATVYVDIAVCPAPFNQNVIAGTVFLDKNSDGINNDGGTGVAGAKVYLYVDGNCNTVINANELKDSVITDASGTYQFITYPEKFVADDFDDVSGARTCANGSDGNAAWLSNWVDAGDPSGGFCNTSQTQANTNAEIYKDGSFTNALRLKNPNVSATRTVNLSGAAYAFLSFSYRRKSATLTAGEDVIVQASSNGSTFGTVFTIAGDGTTDANYVTIYNQDITAYAAATTYIRFLTNANVDGSDTVYIDNIKIQFIRYPQCYITRLDATTVPAYHYTTTILQHNFTATSLQTCLAPYDFGIAKNTISISGTLYHDANGLTDNLINGTVTGTIMGSPVYAYLVDSTGKVVKRTTLNATTGAYTFPNADVLTNYSLRLSVLSVNLGDQPPSDAGFSIVPGNWVNTGNAFGVNNYAGNGIRSGTASADIAVRTGIVNVTAVNFGIERLPESDNKDISYSINTPGVKYDVATGLTGSDSEDGNYGPGNTYKITQLPVGAVLYYNNIVVTLNQVITSFNPALLKIDPDDVTIVTTFMYASRDAAGLYDPTPATVTIRWTQTLPVKLISFSGRLNGTKVDLNWVTASEYNTKHFEVERSTDGINFVKLATVAAKGNSTTVTVYDLVDPAPYKGLNYYRLRIVDFDGSFEYSKIVIIRIENNVQLITRISPNPFTGKIDVYLSLTHNTMVDFRFIDFSGKIVFKKSVKGLKGFNLFTISDLDKLPSAPYLLHIVTDDTLIVEKLIKQ